MIFEFNFFTWATGYTLKKATDWAVSRSFSPDLVTNLQKTVSKWAKGLDEDLTLHPYAIFPLKKDNRLPSPKANGPIETLRKVLNGGHVPTSQQWFDALNEQVGIVQTIGEIQPFFEAPASTTSKKLISLSEDLRRVCSHDEKLFRSYLTNSIDEVHQKLDSTVREIQRLKAGLIQEPKLDIKPIDSDQLSEFLTIPIGQNPLKPSLITKRIRDDEGGCVACSLVDALELMLHQRGMDYHLSSRYLYYGSKQLDGMPDESGTTLSAASNFLLRNGVILNEEWPDDIEDTPLSLPQSVISIQSIISLNPKDDGLFKVLLDRGIPIIITIPVFQDALGSGWVEHTGIFHLPLPSSVVMGGHAVCLVQYEDDSERPGDGYFIFKNSWGTNWASASRYGAGTGMLPYEYVTNYAWESIVIGGVYTNLA